MSDEIKNPVPPSAPGADDQSKANGTPPPANVPPVVSSSLPPSPAPKSPAPFGGHKGGKPTLSGFPVDSKQHAEWKAERERERSRRRREETAKLVQPPLPARIVAPVGSVPPVLPLAGGASPAPLDAGGPVPLAAAGVAVPVGFIAWGKGMLQKPAALFLRIVDRLRKISLNKRVDKFADVLTKDELAEVKKDFEWQDAARKDFEDSLAEVSALGLNKAGVSAEYAPYVNLSMSAGELIYSHISALDRLDKMYALKLSVLKAEREKLQEQQQQTKLN